MNLFAQDALTHDAFLGGALHLWQPRAGYRAGIDPVLLAASVPAKPGQAILDLGCGAGAVGLCLGHRVPGLQLVGVERHAGYAELARRNAAAANVTMEIVEADLEDLPLAVRQQSFDHVVANPPYYDRARGTAAPDPDRETALGQATPLETWVKAATRRLRPKGYLHVILKADALATALTAMARHLGSLEIQPLSPRRDRAAELVILRARKAGKTPLVMHAPIILHEGNTHPGDSEHYTPEIRAVLRCGAPLLGA